MRKIDPKRKTEIIVKKKEGKPLYGNKKLGNGIEENE